MRAFHTVTVPHKDILEGRLTMDVFAADLWSVYQNQAIEEYKDSKLFFEKTYITDGLKTLISTVEKRIKASGGDPVIQLQTPFGGGKTHTLIALFHKAQEWNIKRVAIVGEELKTGSKAEEFETMWGVMEKQLTGKIKNFNSPVPPGGEQIKELLNSHAPALILIDELIPYLNIGDAVKVENSTLTTLTLTFLQILTNVVSELPNVCLVFTTTPSNPYNRTARGEEIVSQLQNITARREIIKAPIRDDEVSEVIKRRLFTSVDEKERGKIIKEFIDYATRESLLPVGIEPYEYRTRFEQSYPFLPEVIDVLYHNWGSFPNFQRTRGVLRLLSLVIHSLKEKNVPYITLADFDLLNQEIRHELIRHIGQEFNGIIDADITAKDAGAKKVDNILGGSYRGLGLASRSATTIFMYSFSGGMERGSTVNEIKRSATTLNNPSSVVVEALDQLKGKLFYLQFQHEKYLFTNQPNLNRILMTRMDNIRDNKLEEVEKELLKKSIAGSKIKVFNWPKEGADIPDNSDLKLVILREQNKDPMKQILETKGSTPRVNRNTVFFLAPQASELSAFNNALRKALAYKSIDGDGTLNLSDQQKKEVKTELKKAEESLNESLRRYYRTLLIPTRDDFKELDLGIPTYGEERKIDEEAYDKLRSEREVLETIAPLVIKERFLKDNTFVLTEQLYNSSAKTPGETRVVSREAWVKGIEEGVKQGLFGLGELEDGKPVCRFFKQHPPVALSGSEIIIREEICIAQMQKDKPEHEAGEGPRATFGGDTGVDKQPPSGLPFTSKRKDVCNEVHLKFTVPRGKVSGIMGVMNLLQSKFNKLTVELKAEDGEISNDDYENKVKETFRQLGIEPEE